MNTFKLKFGDAAAQTLAYHKVTGATLTLNANAPDELSFDVDAAFDAAAHDYGTEVKLYETVGSTDVCRFIGEILELPAETDAYNGSCRRYVARSYLDRLARIQYTQTVRAYDGAATPALADFDEACVVLGRHSRNPFQAATTAQQIADILDYARSLSSGSAFPCSRDTSAWASGFNIPCDQRENVTCWEAILCMLRWMPDHVLWCDYSTGRTVVHLKAASSLAAQTVAASGGTLASVRATPRNDLALPGANVYFRRVDSVDGRTRERRYVQRAGTYSSPFAANLYIDLEGGSLTHVSQEITTVAYPPMGDNEEFRAWLELKIPWLADTASYTIDDVARSGTHAYPRELVGGVIKKWMTDAHEEETINVTVSYLIENEDYTLVDRATVVLPIAVTSTSATSGTYRATASYNSGESPPSGLAAGIYSSWSRLHWDGSLATDLDAAGGWIVRPGALLNVTGGPSALASMGAVVQSCRVDLADGSVEASFGTCRALEADSLCALYRALRGRRHSWKRNLDEADTDGASDETGSGTDGLPQRSGEASPAIARSGLAISGSSSSESDGPVHSFRLMPEDITVASDENVAPQTVQAREMRVIVSDNGAIRARLAQVLCGEPYGDPEPIASEAPQWRVTAEAEADGGWTVKCAGGTVWLFDAALTPTASGAADDANTTYEIDNTARSVTLPPVDLGAAASGAVVWRWTDDSESGEILLASGDTPDGSCDVVLATIDLQESGAPVITQRQIDTIFFQIPTHADGDDGGADAADDPPPCGHPGNGPGGPTDPEHPGDTADEHPGDGAGSGDSTHPGDAEGEGGVTPESSGDCP